MSEKTKPVPRGITPSEGDQESVRKLIREDGEAVAVEKCGLTWQTVARIGSGMPVQRGSLAILHASLGIQGGRFLGAAPGGAS